MITDQINEHEIFSTFINEHLGGLNGKTLEEVLAEFRIYQRQLEDLRGKLRIAEEQSARGESRELDLDALFERVDKRLDGQGVPE